MAYMRGLELVCIGRTGSFEIRYENGRYLDRLGREVDALLDMTCFACGASYYTLDSEEEGLEFCPNCGRFEKRRFDRLVDLLEWSRAQNFDFLKYSGNRAFAVEDRDGWHLAFGLDEAALRRRGIQGEVHLVAGPGAGARER